ncbi:MAG: hypothetical protein Q9185_006021 [Variospora sp. 1 TL-2023]
MALQRRARPHRIIEIPIGRDVVYLPKEIIRSYLPDLWRRNGRYAMRTGYLELPRFGVRDNQQTRIALFIVLRALEASATDGGVASELRTHLDFARRDCTLGGPNPERAMCRIFCNVATLLRPGHAFGRHTEMAYAMSGWFTDLAAEGELHEDTLLKYVIALDWLQAEMTAPLFCFLKQVDVRLIDLRHWNDDGLFRSTTLKKMKNLVKNRPRIATLATGGHLVRGGDLHLKEIMDQWKRDPNSIIVEFPPERSRWADDGYSDHSDYSGTDLDEGYYTTTPPPFSPCVPLRDPAPFRPRQCGSLLAPCERGWNPHAPMNLVRSPSSMLLGAPAVVRPGLPRYHTTR